MKHKGEIIERAVRSSGISVTELARRLKKSRRYVYNLFEKPDVPVETILQIGKFIHYDFSKEILTPEYNVKEFKEGINSINDNNADAGYKPAEYWKNKYLKLLEKYNQLLSEHLTFVKNNNK
jgi:predicted transcriptional regulator